MCAHIVGDLSSRNGHLPRIRRTLCAVVAGWLVTGLASMPAYAGVVVTDHVLSHSAQSQTGIPVTFGQVFKAGDVPKGATLTATLDGRPVSLQVDPKATNPDGSLRHAVLTLVVPSLAGKATLPLAISAAPSMARPT